MQQIILFWQQLSVCAAVVHWVERDPRFLPKKHQARVSVTTYGCVHAGGDWGGRLCRTLGLFHSDHCQGIHLNFPFSAPQQYNLLHMLQLLNATTPILDRFPILLSSQEIQNLKDSKQWDNHEAGMHRVCLQTYHVVMPMTIMGRLVRQTGWVCSILALSDGDSVC